MLLSVDRRTLVRAALVSAIGLVGGTTPSIVTNAAPIRLRRDVNSISADHPIIQTYASAVKYLRALPRSDPRNWTNLATIHSNWCAHQNWYLLPWHREYLLCLERIIRSLPTSSVLGAASFAMPYWDWTRNPKLPLAFTRLTMTNGASNPLLDRSREVGNQASLPSELVGSAVMRRVYASSGFEAFGSSRPAGQTGVENWWQWVTGIQGTLEATPHNSVHNWIAGNMSTMTSPQDPIFFLHHANVDRIWASWSQHGHPNPSANAWLNFVFIKNFVRTNGARYDVRVRDVSMQSYSYDRLDPSPSVARLLSASKEDTAGSVAARGSSMLTFSVAGTRSGTGPISISKIQLPSYRMLPARAVLRILDMKTSGDVLSGVVRVFVNHPDLRSGTQPSGAFYLSTLSFFGNSARSAGDASALCVAKENCFSFELPLDEMLANWRSSGQMVGNVLAVQLVSVGRSASKQRAYMRPRKVEVTFL